MCMEKTTAEILTAFPTHRQHLYVSFQIFSGTNTTAVFRISLFEYNTQKLFYETTLLDQNHLSD